MQTCSLKLLWPLAATFAWLPSWPPELTALYLSPIALPATWPAKPIPHQMEGSILTITTKIEIPSSTIY